MRRRIDTTGIEFRVGGAPMKRTVSKKDQSQKMTKETNPRPIWVVKLTAYDPDARQGGSTEAIWVEVAGPEPVLTVNGIATVKNLVHAPWVNQESKLVESFRAESITMAAVAAGSRS